MITCFSIALLNVVIRRESAYLIEERIKVIVESRKGIIDPVLNRVEGCEYASNAALFSLFTDNLNAAWPGSQTVVSVLSSEATHGMNPSWLDAPSFTGIVEDHGQLEIRFLRMVKRNGCSISVLVKMPLGDAFLGQLSAASGLEVVDSRPVMLLPYRHDEGLAGEIQANFNPRIMASRSSRRHRAGLAVRVARKLGALPDSSQLFADDRRSFPHGIAYGVMGLSAGHGWIWPVSCVCIRRLFRSSSERTYCHGNRYVEWCSVQGRAG